MHDRPGDRPEGMRLVETKPNYSATNPLVRQAGGGHYLDLKIQPIQFILENNMGFVEGNVIKYICRYKLKGTPKEDLEKIKHYVDILLSRLE